MEEYFFYLLGFQVNSGFISLFLQELPVIYFKFEYVHNKRRSYGMIQRMNLRVAVISTMISTNGLKKTSLSLATTFSPSMHPASDGITGEKGFDEIEKGLSRVVGGMESLLRYLPNQ